MNVKIKKTIETMGACLQGQNVRPRTSHKHDRP